MIMSARILVAEDDNKQAELVRRYLEREGHAVVVTHDGRTALDEARRRRPDLLVLDVMMPRVDGLDVCRILRSESDTPIIMLTARSTEDDLLLGLDLGADDYMTKPFDLPELEARVRALIRRGQSGGASELTHGDLVLDTAGRRATLSGEPLDLSARELGVLEVLMMRSGRVVNKEQLAEQLYGWDEEVGPNAIEVYVHRLRKKLEPAGVSIRTIRGLGYLLEKAPSV